MGPTRVPRTPTATTSSSSTTAGTTEVNLSGWSSPRSQRHGHRRLRGARADRQDPAGQALPPPGGCVHHWHPVHGGRTGHAEHGGRARAWWRARVEHDAVPDVRNHHGCRTSRAAPPTAWWTWSGTATRPTPTRRPAPARRPRTRCPPPRRDQPDSDNNSADFQNLGPTPERCNCAVVLPPELVGLRGVQPRHGPAARTARTSSRSTTPGLPTRDLTQVHPRGGRRAGPAARGTLAVGGYRVVDTDLRRRVTGSTELVWENDGCDPGDLVGWGAGAHEGDADRHPRDRPPRAPSATRTTPTPTRTAPTSGPPPRAAAGRSCRRRQRCSASPRSRAPARPAQGRATGSRPGAS